MLCSLKLDYTVCCEFKPYLLGLRWQDDVPNVRTCNRMKMSKMPASETYFTSISGTMELYAVGESGTGQGVCSPHFCCVMPVQWALSSLTGQSGLQLELHKSSTLWDHQLIGAEAGGSSCFPIAPEPKRWNLLLFALPFPAEYISRRKEGTNSNSIAPALNFSHMERQEALGRPHAERSHVMQSKGKWLHCCTPVEEQM